MAQSFCELPLDAGCLDALAAAPKNAALHLIASDAVSDGAALAAALATAAPASLALRTYGALDTDPFKPVFDYCRDHRIPVSVDVVIDDAAHLPTFRLGDGGWLAPVVAMTETLVATRTPVRWILPLTKVLTYRLDGLVTAARETGAKPVLILAETLDPAAAPLAGDDRIFAWDFMAYRMLDEDAGLLTAPRIATYQAMRDHLEGLTDAKPARAEVLAPSGNGDLGYTKAQQRRAMLGDVLGVLAGGVRGHLAAGLKGLKPSAKMTNDPAMPFVLLIGAYGGEHIGDAAILGGVLRRINARHGTVRAILMTQRPYHTRHLIPMLDTPVDVEVMDYSFANIAETLGRVDGVVFAGGPLTDIPKQLVRHIYAVGRAKARGLPFIMEGVGPGTFVRMPSEVTARRFVSMADRIAIRTKDDADRKLVRGCDIDIGQDPAFDYLETRGDPLTRLPDFEPPQITELLDGYEGRQIIGLNIRPIGHVYTPAAPGRDTVAYTYEVQDRFERAFAAGLEAYAERQDAPPMFVFFPMNAIQFGMSDLRSAHRIMSHMTPGTDYRIWEADASLDGVVALIRRFDAVVSMRFHATIFALSQNCPVLGIDYRIGKRDKVAAVLSDAGFPDNVCRIDELTATWLSDKLTGLKLEGD